MSDTTTTNDNQSVASQVSEWGAVAVSLVVLAVFVLALTIAWHTGDASLPLLLGAASANATTVVGFWIGSSRGSQKKDNTIAAQAAATTTPAAMVTTTTPVAPVDTSKP